MTDQKLNDFPNKDSIFDQSFAKDLRGTNKFIPRPNVVTNVQAQKPKSVVDHSQVPHKFLTRDEMRARREADLCFNCDEKWVAGHKCKTTTLYIMMFEEQETNYLHSLEDTVVETTEEIEEHVPVIEGELSINAITGSISPNTMKFLGEYENHKIYILMDTGSCNTWLDSDAAHKMGCKISPAPLVYTNIAGGGILSSNEICHNFRWTMHGQTFCYTMRLIKLGGYQMVVGGDWLKTFGIIEVDYLNMRLGVVIKDKKVYFDAINEKKEIVN